MTSAAPDLLTRVRSLVLPALQAAIATLEDERMRRVAAYHLGWCDADGRPLDTGGGKSIRPALAVLSAQAGGGSATDGVPAATAVELVHNFSLLHDDIMDRDVERRHRPTGWVVFGDGQAILAGNAMLTVGIEVLVASGAAGRRSLPCLLTTVQRLIGGQSEDLALEDRPSVELDEVLHMEAGKTAALLACSASIGALAVEAAPQVVDALAAYGHALGMSFQLVDDILGITGDASVTGKSASSDIRAGKRSAPIVAALRAGVPAAERLSRLLAAGPPETDGDVTHARKLIEEAGGLDWAAREADAFLAQALAHLAGAPIPAPVASELADLARYVVERDR
ncbi:MAG: polyprenyl synthetase family protein [Jatrophihabitantaceae bacterium]